MYTDFFSGMTIAVAAFFVATLALTQPNALSIAFALFSYVWAIRFVFLLIEGLNIVDQEERERRD